MTESAATRWVSGRLDPRILALGGQVSPGLRLPVAFDGGLDARGCEVDVLVLELARLAREMVPAWASMRPTAPLATPTLELVAALALDALAELDAVSVILGVVALDALDRALAPPLEAWSHRGQARPDAPALRTLARSALADERAPGLGARLASSAGALRLTLAVRERRDAMRRLGAALDARRPGNGPVSEIALAIACRAREATALGEAVVHHLEHVDGGDTARAWSALVLAIGDRLPATLAGADRLIGMEP